MTGKLLGTLLACVFSALLWAGGVLAQSNPTNTPSYTPTSVLYGSTISSTASFPAAIVWTTNNANTVLVTISGTYTGLSGQFQVATERQGTVVWTTIGVLPMGGAGGTIKVITSNGTYRIDGLGAAKLQFVVSALSTGTVQADYASTVSEWTVTASHERRPTYRTFFSAITPAASATDMIVIPGNATTTVRIQRIACFMTATANGQDQLFLIKRSVADTVATPTNGTAVPLDANDPAAKSIAFSYAANPTLGAAVGTIDSQLIAAYNATTMTLAPAPFVWTFGDRWNEELTLRGTTQQLAINNNGASVPSGGLLSCSIEHTEE